MTPIPARIARPLADGLRNPVVCRNDDAVRLMPQQLLTVAESVEAAIGVTTRHAVETAWSDAGVIPGDPDWAGGTTFEDRREILTTASPADAFRGIRRVGGGHGYYAADWLWHLRGALDRLVGGPGLRRGRRDPDEVGYGDALDFWRVTGFELDRRLELRAEMKLPGEASLAFDVEPEGSGSRIVQTARFKPRGLLGLAYWYAVLPFHAVVFRGMLEGIRKEAESAPQEAADRSAADSAG